MIVKKQQPIVFDNACGALFEDWQLEQAILWAAQVRPVCRLKRVFMHGRYPAVSIHGDKYHIHRLILSWYHKRALERTEYAHHKNENKLDARLSNLEVVGQAEHQSHHNKGRKQFPEHVAKRTAAMKRTRYENPELLANQKGQ